MALFGKPRIGWVKLSTIVIAPFIIALATQFLRPVIFGDTTSPSLYWVVLVTLSIAWAVLMLIGADSEAQKQEKSEDRLDRLSRQTDFVAGRVSSTTSVSYVGLSDGSEVLDSIQSQLTRAKLVRNSLVGMPEEEQYEGKITSIYQRFFEGSSGARWLDLGSFAELFGGRFRQRLPKSVKRRHRVRALRHSVPLVNCTILTLEDDTEIAYFGWTFATPNGSAPVFKTDDPKLVDFFKTYFDMLWEKRTTKGEGYVSYEKGRGEIKGIDVVDRFGRWVTVATVKENDKETVESYAVIDIDLTATPKVQGCVFNKDMTAKSTLEATDAYATTNRIDFDYPAYPGEPEPSGRCQYRFAQYDGQDIFTGFFVNDRSRVWKDVIGIKVEAGPRRERSNEAPRVTLSRHREQIDLLLKTRRVGLPKGRFPSSNSGN